MLINKGITIEMDEGDYGVSLTYKLKGDVLSSDVIKLKIKNSEEVFIEKEFTNLIEKDGKTEFTFTISQEDSDKLKAGTYYYGIKQYRNDILLNTIIRKAEFKVIKDD